MYIAAKVRQPEPLAPFPARRSIDARLYVYADNVSTVAERLPMCRCRQQGEGYRSDPYATHRIEPPKGLTGLAIRDDFHPPLWPLPVPVRRADCRPGFNEARRESPGSRGIDKLDAGLGD